MIPHITPQEILLIVIVALLIFGPKRLPELARGMGEAIREFRSSVSGGAKPEPEKAPARLEKEV
ncbi:MAG: twin-arginine translocase TatA/TatE family subunit [Anaerolineae bacterium]|nr:twin-arginine translocase TatA/TatE family subunit [Anaerolineae bacterium]